MKKIVFALVAGLLVTCIPATASSANSSVRLEISTNADLSPRIINAILKKVCKDWGLSLGQAWQEYHDGNLTITKSEVESYYFVDYQNSCILISIVEDL